MNKIDKNLQVGNDNFRISLYYKGKLIQVLNKPKTESDVVAWGQLTENMVNEAIRVSPTAAEKGFLVDDVLAEGMVSVLDEASKYYRSSDEVGGGGRNRRVFSVRDEEKFFYVKIKAFNKQTVTDLRKEFEKYDGKKGIVFDLRGCSGGMAGAAIEAADLFLDTGIICSIKDKNAAEQTYFVAEKGDIAKRNRIFILTDEKTASAAEIFAAALQEQSRAEIIGTLTTGKGSMQKLISVPNGGVLAVTNSFVFTPSGRQLNTVGIIPDICTFERNESANINAL
ncbi:MAG: S41 family peptidase, partial [Alphaproteobacteria bacterium]|nr:S41 family peptidase [Alphaproteobacteria bacterium]